MNQANVDDVIVDDIEQMAKQRWREEQEFLAAAGQPSAFTGSPQSVMDDVLFEKERLRIKEQARREEQQRLAKQSQVIDIIDVQGLRFDDNGDPVDESPSLSSFPSSTDPDYSSTEDGFANSSEAPFAFVDMDQIQKEKEAKLNDMVSQQTDLERENQRVQEQNRLQIAKRQKAAEEEKRRAEEKARLERELAAKKEAQKAHEKAEQKRILAETVAKADDEYRPSSDSLMNNTSLLLKEIQGPALTHSRPQSFSDSHAVVYAARSLDIPVRVDLPGTMIEFSIEKKASEFKFGISGYLEGPGETVPVKKFADFSKHSKKKDLLEDVLVVGVTNVPCTLTFKFENTYQNLLDKVIVNYKIKVTPPSKDEMVGGRNRRAKATIKMFEDELNTLGERKTVAKRKVDGLTDEIEKLKKELEEKQTSLESLKKEESRWEKLLAKIAKSASPPPTSVTIDTTATNATAEVVSD